MANSLYSRNAMGNLYNFMSPIITEISVDVLNAVIKFYLID